MTFSATGNILSGSIWNPNYENIVETGASSRNSQTTSNNTWNVLGYIPVVSTITGCGRLLVATVHAIVHLAAAIFDRCHRGHHLVELQLAGLNIARAVGEMTPLLGNLILLIVDGVKHSKNDSLFRGEIGTVAVVADGMEAARMDLILYRIHFSDQEASFQERLAYIRQSAAG